MPQMAPISWLTLFILFSVLYILYAILNYFSAVPAPKSQTSTAASMQSISYNWKW